MAKRKPGIHKKISSIFDGIPVPRDNGARRASGAPTQDRTDYVPPKPPAPHPQTPPTPEPQRPGPERPSYVSPKPLTPFPQIPPTLKPQRPAVSLPKAAPAKRPKARAVIKTPGSKSAWKRVTNKLFAPKPGVSAARQKTMAVSVLVLFITLVFVLIRVFGAPSRKTTRPQETEPEPVDTQVVVASNNKIDWQIPTLYPTTIRDPMKTASRVIVETTEPETEPEPEPEPYKLIVKGIVYSEDEPSAVIDTRVVREGETISGVTIIKINEDSVEFERDGERWKQKVEQ